MRLFEILAASVWATLATVAGGVMAAIAVAHWLFNFGFASAVAFYFVVWWVVLFVTLPLGAHSQQDEGLIVHGTEPGAPARPRIGERAILTTLLTDAVFLLSVMLLPLAGL